MFDDVVIAKVDKERAIGRVKPKRELMDIILRTLGGIRSLSMRASTTCASMVVGVL
jgi:hypothetical protein